jgi:hypothetical protein
MDINQLDPSDQMDYFEEKANGAEGESKVAFLREAVRVADTANDVPRGMGLRDMLIEAASDAGFYEDELLAFNWMLVQFDRDPQTWEDIEHGLLWKYKWILEHLHRYPQVSRERIDATFADMERRYTRAGQGLRAMYKLRCISSLEMGEPARAAEFEKLWRSARADGSQDCKACEVGNHVEYFIDSGQDEKAFEAARPLAQRGMRCAEVPNTTFSRMLVPLLRAGKLKEAVKCQEASFEQMRESRKFVSHLADHLTFWALTGEMTKAVRLMEARLPWAQQTRELYAKFRFYSACRVLMARLHHAGRASVNLRLTAGAQPHRQDDTYDTAALAEWFGREARRIAEQFDRRNGNDYYTRELTARTERLIEIPEVALPPGTGSGREAA